MPVVLGIDAAWTAKEANRSFKPPLLLEDR
jgi:hypothetical protein